MYTAQCAVHAVSHSTTLGTGRVSVSGPLGGCEGCAKGFGLSLSLGSFLRRSVKYKKEADPATSNPTNKNTLGPLRGGRPVGTVDMVGEVRERFKERNKGEMRLGSILSSIDPILIPSKLPYRTTASAMYIIRLYVKDLMHLVFALCSSLHLVHTWFSRDVGESQSTVSWSA